MSRRTRRRARQVAVVSAGLGLVTVMTAGVASAATTPVSAHRAYGADRYLTATILEERNSADTPARQTAYLVTGEDYADGVTAGALAGRPGSNIFLTKKDSLPQEVRDVIGYYGRVVVVGSEDAIGPGVMTWLQQNTRATLSRIGGVDRYDTAAQLSASTFAPGVSNVLVATGGNYADALAGSAAAASVNSPMLLVKPGSVPASVAAELTRLRPGTITVLGGTGAVGADVEADLAKHTTGTVTRLQGSDRYTTAIAISKAFFPTGTSRVDLAAGTSWPDAIAAGADAAHGAGALLLTPQYCLPQSVNQEIQRLTPTTIEAVGGDSSYSDAASKRTSCGSSVVKYLDAFGTPLTGSARFVDAAVTLNGTYYPRTVGYESDARNSEYRTWNIASGWSRFTSTAGVADGVASGLTSHIEVYGDEKLLGSYDVAVGRTAAIDLPVTGVDNLKIVTTSSARTGTGVDANTVYFGDAGVS